MVQLSGEVLLKCIIFASFAAALAPLMLTAASDFSLNGLIYGILLGSVMIILLSIFIFKSIQKGLTDP